MRGFTDMLREILNFLCKKIKDNGVRYDLPGRFREVVDFLT